MARFNFSEADNYDSSNSVGYFSLKNDGDKAKVRILYTDVNDIDGYAVYRVPVGDRERYVNSIRAYNDPVENDPFAAAGHRTQAKMFIPLYNEDTGDVVLWERGKTYFGKIAALANNCGASPQNPLYNQTFIITRHGAKGDLKTDYDFWPAERSEFDINSIDVPSPLGTMILDKTYDEMAYYIQYGDFPTSSQTVAQNRQANYSAPQQSTPQYQPPFNEDSQVRRRPQF